MDYNCNKCTLMSEKKDLPHREKEANRQLQFQVSDPNLGGIYL